MKHVIAGQTDEDVIEWRFSLDSDGGPRLQARKGNDCWYTVLVVEGKEVTLLDSGCEPFGLKSEIL